MTHESVLDYSIKLTKQKKSHTKPIIEKFFISTKSIVCSLETNVKHRWDAVVRYFAEFDRRKLYYSKKVKTEEKIILIVYLSTRVQKNV
jgi:hypothetical protein